MRGQIDIYKKIVCVEIKNCLRIILLIFHVAILGCSKEITIEHHVKGTKYRIELNHKMEISNESMILSGGAEYSKLAGVDSNGDVYLVTVMSAPDDSIPFSGLRERFDVNTMCEADDLIRNVTIKILGHDANEILCSIRDDRVLIAYIIIQDYDFIVLAVESQRPGIQEKAENFIRGFRVL